MLKKLFAICAAAAMIVGCGQKNTTTLTKSGLNPEDFNAERDGAAVALYTLTNKAGMEVCITNFGGRIVSIMVPDRNGEFKDVVHGFSTIKDYFPENNKTDFGATIGRYANRIANGKITVDGVEYQLPQNNYGHCLHGGPNGWQYKVAEVVETTGNSIKLKFDSPDGEANFPGHVTAFVTFTLTEDNAIDIDYEATTDKATVINMTNHSYFNLSGDGNNSIEGNELYVNASNFTPVDDTFMTTGEIAPVEGTPMDFRVAKAIGKDINADYDQLHNGKGYDHNWVLDTQGDKTVLAAELYCPESGIVLKEYTNEPGVQVYVGNFLDGTVTGKRGVTYNFRTAVCLETQHYPDTPNKPDWPTAVLRPGETYHSFCRFAFSTK
jgi:aldose 1-epimerase